MNDRTGLRGEGVTVRYGGVLAVDTVDIDVRPGEIVGLIGPNGAGKTSLIDALLGFTPSTGRVTIDGHDVSRAPTHRVVRLGLARTWQSPDLFGDLTVAENLEVASEPGRPLRTLLQDVFRRRRPPALAPGLAMYDLADRLDSPPSALSLGQQKLLGVARSLVSHPTVVLLDEPAAGLDSDESLRLGGQLRTLADQGLGMLLVDHHMDLVFSACDRVVVLEFGTVIATGTPEQVRRSPAVLAAYLGSPDADDAAHADHADNAGGGPGVAATPHLAAGGAR